jgi:hypothetical protein
MSKLIPLTLLVVFACGTAKEQPDSRPANIDTAAEGADTDAPDGGAVDTQGSDSSTTDSGAVDSGEGDTGSGDSGTVDTGSEPPVDLDVDLDGDGFSVEDGDCDDLDSSRHPARDEVCDGIDNNCDGRIDEDATTLWFLDFDGDGHGTEAFTYDGCTPLDGYVSLSDDCDDTSDLAFPGGTEVCDSIDNNCDGSIDEDVTETYFLDEDGDSFGDAGFAIEACSLPAGYADNSEDCHDLDGLIHPGAEERCDGVDNDCDGEVDEASAVDVLTYHRDADADGFGALDDTTAACSMPEGFVDDASDCDDHDDDIHPRATEACDGEDNDCDGYTDEEGATGETTWYPDDDADSYGAATGAVDACTSPPGHVSVAGDCDDSEPLISPEGVESCNGIDDDCDGETDEAGATGGSTWYLDSDLDGYGDPAAAFIACAMPSGYVANLDDCDDHDDDSHPGATETCDGEDNNCDGEIDEDGATGAPIWYPDSDGDFYGATAGATASCLAPPGFVGLAGDCDDTTSAISPAVSEICNDIDDDCDGETDEDGAAGATLWYLDADGDGHGTALTSLASCELPEGYTSSSDDCDDADSGAYPGATEIPDDGIDQDCDGEDLLSPPFTGSEDGWYHANYDGVFGDYNPSIGYNGTVSCPTTCEHYGLTATGARFVCNVAYGSTGSTEGCTPSTEGMYGTANCGQMVRDLAITTENGNTEDCAGGNIMGCATSSCSEGVTYHSIECQCI